MQRFRGGLVFKAHRLWYHSTLGLSVMKGEGGAYSAPWVELGLTSGGAIAPIIAVDGSSPSAICDAIGTSGACIMVKSLGMMFCG